MHVMESNDETQIALRTLSVRRRRKMRRTMRRRRRRRRLCGWVV